VAMGMMWTAFDGQYRSETAKQQHKRLKALGLPRGGTGAPYGMKKVYRVQSQGKPRPEFVWDAQECRDIVELVERVRSGEPIMDIARDWHRHNRRRANGVEWVRISELTFGAQKAIREGRHPTSGLKLNSGHLRKAYRWAEKELAEKGCIGTCEVEVPLAIDPATGNATGGYA